MPDDTLHCFNATCPHLGCFVNAKSDASYYCPCHKSEFQADGERGKECVSPRGLDPLEVKVEDGDLYVLYKNFIPSKKERIPV